MSADAYLEQAAIVSFFFVKLLIYNVLLEVEGASVVAANVALVGTVLY
jgi:hypothetical protein